MTQAFAARQSAVSTAAADRKVLVVEDEPDLLELLTECFTSDGYEVLVALDGQAATRLARRKQPDLIVLDLMLPGQSGHEVLGDLAADPRTRDIPVVVLSAYTRTLQRTPQVKAVLEKPFDLWELLGLAADLSGAAEAPSDRLRVA